jgi:hypothetical protein
MFKSNTATQQERIEVCHDWVNMCVSANIPLFRTDHPPVRNFLLTRVRNGGAIPGGQQLQENYLADLYRIERDKLKALLKDEYVAVIFDEMSDAEGRFVLNILLAPTKINKDVHVIAYLADTIMLQKVDNVTVSQAVISTLSWYGICFDSISVFDTDNAAYCLKAVQTLEQLCPNALNITCLAHIMNLIGQAFKSPFQLVTSFVVYFSRIFYNAGAWKGRFLSYLRAELEKNLDVLTESTAETSKARQKPIVTMPPSSVATRWNSWFLCVSYHNKYFKYYKKFFRSRNAAYQYSSRIC